MKKMAKHHVEKDIMHRFQPCKGSDLARDPRCVMDSFVRVGLLWPQKSRDTCSEDGRSREQEVSVFRIRSCFKFFGCTQVQARLGLSDHFPYEGLVHPV